jgi:hypothetical protein
VTWIGKENFESSQDNDNKVTNSYASGSALLVVLVIAAHLLPPIRLFWQPRIRIENRSISVLCNALDLKGEHFI